MQNKIQYNSIRASSGAIGIGVVIIGLIKVSAGRFREDKMVYIFRNHNVQHWVYNVPSRRHGLSRRGMQDACL